MQWPGTLSIITLLAGCPQTSEGPCRTLPSLRLAQPGRVFLISCCWGLLHASMLQPWAQSSRNLAGFSATGADIQMIHQSLTLQSITCPCQNITCDTRYGRCLQNDSIMTNKWCTWFPSDKDGIWLDRILSMLAVDSPDLTRSYKCRDEQACGRLTQACIGMQQVPEDGLVTYFSDAGGEPDGKPAPTCVW